MRLVLAYKNFAANKHISHIGLGVAALNNAKSLRAAGITTDVHPIVDSAGLRKILAHDGAQAGITHVVISAPWIPSLEMQAIALDHPDVQFVMNCHSNVGFLQADSNGVRLIREALDIQRGTWNFHVAGNSHRFVRWIEDVYQQPCLHLPNLYHLDGPPAHRPAWRGGHLRIGAFGATRPLKNFMSAAAASLEIAARERAELEIWVSVGRTEGGGDTILRAVRAMVAGLPTVKLVEAGWQSWPQFRATVRQMHLLMQPSYTESFNMVTADGVAEGVPSVVSEAIDWAPAHWQASTDDPTDIARIGRGLLHDPHAVADGFRALAKHNADGLRSWKAWLHQQ